MPQESQQTTVVRLGAVPYYVRPRVEAKLPKYDGRKVPSVEFLAATVIHLPSQEALDSQIIEATFQRFFQEDDVFSKSFTENAHLIVSLDHVESKSADDAPNQIKLDTADKYSPELTTYFQSHQLEVQLVSKLPIPEGPYFLRSQELHQAWRLFPDSLGSFTSVLVPDDSKPGFKSLSDVAFTGVSTPVAVPSRLYFLVPSAKENRPLYGQRVSVKDNMDIAGVVTGIGSKSYARLYGIQKTNAAIVQLLVDQGAIVVGKTKLSAFAGSEAPPNQAIDYFPPWNARGDGYQAPSGSSGGAGSCTAGYDWLDLSICTDTGGSTRFPATSHGVWGIKASWNAIPVEGLVTSCTLYDSFGLFARNSGMLQKTLAAANFSPPPNSLPTKLLFPEEWFPLANEAQQAMTDTFFEAIQAYLGLQMTRISLEDEWKRTGPEHIRNKTLLELCDSGQRLYGYDMFHNFDHFRAEYKDTFGELAYVSPTHTARWDKWKGTTKEERDADYKEVVALRSWWQDTIFSGPNNPNTVMIVPHGRPGPNYRDTAMAPPSPPVKVDPIITSSMAGLPQILVPIGQNPYESRISGRTEYVPIFTTLVGAPGTDAALLKIAQDTLDQAGWPSEVLTGRYMFTVGSNVRHSAKTPPGKL